MGLKNYQHHCEELRHISQVCDPIYIYIYIYGANMRAIILVVVEALVLCMGQLRRGEIILHSAQIPVSSSLLCTRRSANTTLLRLTSNVDGRHYLEPMVHITLPTTLFI